MPIGILNTIKMADDLNKNITITVTTETDKLQQNIVSLNNTINDLLIQQKQLDAAGQQNSATFDAVSAKINALQKSLKDATTQLNTQTTALGSLGTAAKTTEATLGSLNKQLQNTQKAAGNSSSKTKDLSTQLNSLGQATKQQKSSIDSAAASISKHASSTAKSASSAKKLKSNVDQTGTAFHGQVSKINNSKKAFDGHKQTIDLLKTSFDKIKGISGEFGPSLQDVAQGFNAMKSGFEVVKGGLKGVGEAIDADGFGFLLKILNYLFTAFMNSSTGTKMLQGAISAIGVVVNKVSDFFQSLKDGIMNAFSHPLESIKHLGQIIEQNIINRFKAFGVILDGIIHLDFKKIANGVIQASTGITDATDKIGTAITKVKEGLVTTTTAMVTAYNNGYDQAGQAVDKHEKKVKDSTDKQIEYLENVRKKAQDVYNEENKASQSNSRGTDLDPAKSAGVSDTAGNDFQNKTIPTTTPTVLQTQSTATASVNIYKKAFTQIEAEAKASAGKIATNAISSLENSIKQQSEAKVAALEKDKNAELSNSSLTSAQKLAINAKYKKQEDQVKAKAFKQEQELSIAQAVINGALAVTKVSAQSGLLAALSVGVVVAETAAEVAKIASQKPPAYAKGGLHYASDGRGGVLPGYSRTDNTNAYLRSGEGIVVSEAMRDPWARNLVSAINVGFGGRDFSTTNTGRGFAVGGIFTDGGDANRYYNQPVTDNKNLANSIAYQMVNNFPPVYVDVKDINNQQNILAQTINRVNL
jgi:predicted  nucleic acid-binding Zn-ribbon protein